MNWPDDDEPNDNNPYARRSVEKVDLSKLNTSRMKPASEWDKGQYSGLAEVLKAMGVERLVDAVKKTQASS